MFRKIFIPVTSFIFLLPLIGLAQNFGGNPASLKWRQVNNKISRVIFPEGLDSQANRISNIVSLLDTATLYSIGNRYRKWNIVLLNQTTVPNAYVRLAPVISELFMTPGQNNFSNGSLRWDDNLIIHEDRHMQQFSNFNKGLTKVFSFFLGQEGQLLANGISIPDYFYEGDAVWQETLVSKQGRGRLAEFFNGPKSLHLGQKKYSWMKLRSGSLLHYTPDHYQTGYQLVAYGYEKYGENFWRKVTEDAVRFKGLFYAFNKAIEKYSAKSYKQFREDALEYFRQQTIATGVNEKDKMNYITPLKNDNVVDYLFPQFVTEDTIVVTKQSFKAINSFYFLINGKEKKIRVKDYVIDDYFSYNNGKIVYAAYQSDPRWTNRNYSVIQLLDIYSKKQRQLTFKSKYFSPDINKEGTEVLAVSVNTNGSNYLHRINAATGEVVLQLPNAANYFFTQTKYINSNTAVAAVRNPAGEMALVKVNLQNGEIENLIPFTYNVVGYPCVKGDTVYYTKMDNGDHKTAVKNPSPADRIFAVTIRDKKNYRLTNNSNGVYQPAVNDKGALLFAAFTADGYRLAKLPANEINWQQTATIESNNESRTIAAAEALGQKGSQVLYQLQNNQQIITRYKKSFQLFNFHSARPVVNDPEYGYTFYSDNILSNFNNSITYTYNRNEQSHGIGYNAVYGGLFPFLSVGAERTFHRSVDTALGKTVNYDANKINLGFSIPLNIIGGRTFKYVNFGANYNIEQLPFFILNKNTIEAKAVNYGNAFFIFSNASRQARQNINPAWAQTFRITYRDAFNLLNNHKLVGSASLYFPGLFTNHSLVIDAAYQKRDSVGYDLFSNTFSFSRGYQALNQRRMYKLGINYHFPLFYPDWGFGNIVFFQRIRANAFYDYTSSLTKFRSGQVIDIKNRSTGGEIYFDTKIWNELPVSIGVRYSRLLDYDYGNPGAVNRWEIILPISIIPN